MVAITGLTAVSSSFIFISACCNSIPPNGYYHQIDLISGLFQLFAGLLQGVQAHKGPPSLFFSRRIL